MSKTIFAQALLWPRIADASDLPLAAFFKETYQAAEDELEVSA